MGPCNWLVAAFGCSEVPPRSLVGCFNGGWVEGGAGDSCVPGAERESLLVFDLDGGWFRMVGLGGGGRGFSGGLGCIFLRGTGAEC